MPHDGPLILSFIVGCSFHITDCYSYLFEIYPLTTINDEVSVVRHYCSMKMLSFLEYSLWSTPSSTAYHLNRNWSNVSVNPLSTQCPLWINNSLCFVLGLAGHFDIDRLIWAFDSVPAIFIGFVWIETIIHSIFNQPTLESYWSYLTSIVA